MRVNTAETPPKSLFCLVGAPGIEPETGCLRDSVFAQSLQPCVLSLPPQCRAHADPTTQGVPLIHRRSVALAALGAPATSLGRHSSRPSMPTGRNTARGQSSACERRAQRLALVLVAESPVFLPDVATALIQMMTPPVASSKSWSASSLSSVCFALESSISRPLCVPRAIAWVTELC